MKLIKSDLENAITTYKGYLENDATDSATLRSLISDFVDNSKANGLEGEGYDACRRYLDGLYKNLLIEREEICNYLITVINSADNGLIEYMGSDNELDTANLESLHSTSTTISNELSGLRGLSEKQKREKYGLDGAQKVASYIRGKELVLADINKKIDKLDRLFMVDANAAKKFINISEKIYKFSSNIGKVSVLSDGIATNATGDDGNNTTQPQITPGSPGPYTPGTSSPGGGAEDPSTPGTGSTQTTPVDPQSKPIGQAVVAAAVGLLGMTSAQLAADTNNGVYSVANYTPGEPWSTKFVNDVIRRDPRSVELLTDYYNTPTEYKEPYTSSTDMIKYAMKSDSNMEFNWSNGAISTITDYNAEKGYDEVKYTNYTPKEGDIVFFDRETENGTFSGNTADVSATDRVGIVESVSVIKDTEGNERTLITVIEGDMGSDDPDTSSVVRRTYYADSKEILGYGTIKEYSKETDTSNNHNGEQNGVIPEPETPETPETPITPGKTEPSEETPIKIEEGDVVGNEGEGTVDSEGIQRNTEGKEIGKVELEHEEDGTAIVEEEDIPGLTKPLPEEEPEKETPIDMSEYSDRTGEHFDDIDPNLIVWDWENMEDEEQK